MRWQAEHAFVADGKTNDPENTGFELQAARIEFDQTCRSAELDTGDDRPQQIVLGKRGSHRHRDLFWPDGQRHVLIDSTETILFDRLGKETVTTVDGVKLRKTGVGRGQSAGLE